MKRVEFIDRDKVNTRQVIQTVMETPQNGNNAANMRRRVRVLDALEAAKDGKHVDLEDADFNFLHETVEAFTFGVANRDLLDIIDGIAASKQPPKLKAVEK